MIKYNNNGDFVWQRDHSGAGEKQNSGLEIDSQNNIYVVWFFTNTLNLGNDINDIPVVLSVDGYRDSYIVKYEESTGKILKYQQTSVGYAGIENKKILIDNSSNIYVLGSFNSSSLELGNDINNNLISVSNWGIDEYGEGFSHDIFLLKFNSLLNLDI